MIKKATTKLMPGEVLGQPVKDDAGNVLAQSGVPVTESLIRVLTKRGVREVVIRPTEAVDHDNEPEAKRPTSVVRSSGSHRITEIHNRLTETFEGCMDDPIMSALFEATKNYLEAKMSAEKDTQ